MIVMDKPVNKAHFQARKAEQYLSDGKYSDAVACHEQAVVHLDEALDAGVPATSLESLTLQRDNHIKQQGVIRLRQHQADARKQHAQRLAQAQFPEIPVATDRPDGAAEDYNFCRTLAETDSLLHFMRSRKLGSMVSVSDFIRGRSAGSDYKKLPKDSLTVMEELRMQNSLLRDHVIQLLVENESLRETARQSALVDSSEPGAFCDLPVLGACLSTELQSPALDLPPLDIPQFHFQPET